MGLKGNSALLPGNTVGCCLPLQEEDPPNVPTAAKALQGKSCSHAAQTLAMQNGS